MRDPETDQTLDGKLVQVESVDGDLPAAKIGQDPIGHAVETGREPKAVRRRAVGERGSILTEFEANDIRRPIDPIERIDDVPKPLGCGNQVYH